MKKGITGENLLTMLERRLDNVVYLMGLAASRRHGRQLISQAHYLVNDRKVTVPSFLVSEGDVITFRPRSAQSAKMKELVERNRNKTVPGWIEMDWDNLKGKITALPTRQDVTLPIEERYIVELYSK
jgi:small subunit ribosomal protein S4